MRLFKTTLISTAMLMTAFPAYANSCNMWGEARANRDIQEFDLKAMAAAVKKNEFRTVKNCYGTELLKTDIEMTPFSLTEAPTGKMNIISRQTGASSRTTFETSGQTYELKTRGDKSYLLGSDDKWHDIQDMENLMPPLEALQNSRIGIQQSVEWLKQESDAHLAPISDSLVVVGLGGMMSAMAIPYMLQYAPLADSDGINEQIGGYSTTIWSINNKKAEMYAASRGLPIDTTGSHIRYWVTDKGLVIKIDAKFGSALTQGPTPMTLKYRVAKSAAPDPSWWD